MLPCVRISSCLEPQAPVPVFLIVAYSVQVMGILVHGGAIYHLKEGEQRPCGVEELLFGKTLLKTVHPSVLVTNINIYPEKFC